VEEYPDDELLLDNKELLLELIVKAVSSDIEETSVMSSDKCIIIYYWS
jgi:hypothetical protein